MPDIINSAQQLVDAGWAVAFVVLGGLNFLAIIRGWVVPRFAYDREVGRADKNFDQLDANTSALKSLTDEVRRDRRP